MHSMTPTPERLRELISYDPKTGVLTWRERTKEDISDLAALNGWNARFAGKTAFQHLTPHGYMSGCVLAKTLQAHRVAWAIFYGSWPTHNIDHINGIKTDNCIENLRDVTQVENAMNSKVRVNNKYGVTGVHWCKRANKWRARINKNGKTREIGTFRNFDDAVLARQNAKRAAGYGLTYEGK